MRPEMDLVVAVSDDDVIGRDNRLPWHLPADLQHFKRLTWGKCILMGRRTHESIGRALPGRTNLILSRTLRHAPGCTVVRTLDEACRLAEARPSGAAAPGTGVPDALASTAAATDASAPAAGDAIPPPPSVTPGRSPSPGAALVVIGGAEIFRLCLPFVERIHLTQVHTTLGGDVFFADWRGAEWRTISMEPHAADANNPVDYCFLTLCRSR